MKNILVLAALGFAAFAAYAAEPAPAPTAAKPALKTFLIILRLPPRLHDEHAWSDADKAATGAHFARLKAATDAGQVILAGRTAEPLDRTQGLVIFTAADEAAAREFMNADPCVAAGVMTATLHPYDLALLRQH
jgi:uncharacterized protein YciI